MARLRRNVRVLDRCALTGELARLLCDVRVLDRYPLTGKLTRLRCYILALDRCSRCNELSLLRCYILPRYSLANVLPRITSLHSNGNLARIAETCIQDHGSVNVPVHICHRLSVLLAEARCKSVQHQIAFLQEDHVIRNPLQILDQMTGYHNDGIPVDPLHDTGGYLFTRQHIDPV